MAALTAISATMAAPSQVASRDQRKIQAPWLRVAITRKAMSTGTWGKQGGEGRGAWWAFRRRATRVGYEAGKGPWPWLNVAVTRRALRPRPTHAAARVVFTWPTLYHA